MKDKNFQKDNDPQEEDFTFEDEEDIVGEATSKDKLKNLRKKLEDIGQEKQKLQEDLQRAKADFINMRRRDEADLQKALKLANENLFLEIIPVLDSFELAFKDLTWNEAPPDLKEGMTRVYEQLKSILTKNNVKILDPLNETFDPTLHTAVAMSQTDKEDEDHQIEEVLQRGYLLNNKVIRSPKVKIKEFKK